MADRGGRGPVTPLASVLVVTWNGRALLERCLPALDAQTLRDREIVVVDNGSTDRSAELVARVCPAAVVVRSATNLDFASGTSLGLERCRGRSVAQMKLDYVAVTRYMRTDIRGSVGT